MKTNLVRMLAIAALAATSGLAQNDAILQANVPFDFTMGNQTMPSGQYLVDPSLNAHVMVFRSADRKHSYLIMGTTVTSTAGQRAPKLVFHRYGGQYFLSEVWTRGGDQGSQFPRTPRERELSSQQSNPAAPVTIALR